MEYWIDGYNLILHRDSRFQGMPLDQARETLLQALASVGSPVRVFFDASRFPGGWAGAAPTAPSVRTVFVKTTSADDAIVDQLRSANARAVTVVTDDRELRMRARQVGAQSVAIDKFQQRLDRARRTRADSTPKEPRDLGAAGGNRTSLSKGEVDEWLDYMGIDEDWQPDDEG